MAAIDSQCKAEEGSLHGYQDRRVSSNSVGPKGQQAMSHGSELWHRRNLCPPESMAYMKGLKCAEWRDL